MGQVFLSSQDSPQPTKKAEEEQSTSALDYNPQLPPGPTHPQLAVIVEGIQQLDYVVVVAGGQDIDLHHVVLQLLLGLGVDHFGCSQDARLLVLSL